MTGDESAFVVNDIANDRRAALVHLRLIGSALDYYQTLDDAVKNDYGQLVQAFRNQFVNVERALIHKIQLKGLKLPTDTNPEAFLAKIRAKAIFSYPNAARTCARLFAREAFINSMPSYIKKRLLDTAREILSTS